MILHFYPEIHIPTAAVFVLALLLARKAWERRSTPGTIPTMMLMLIIALCAATACMENATTSLELKLFGANIDVLCYATLPVLWLVMLLEYLGYSYLITRRNLILTSLCPLICVIFCWTNSFHHLFFSQTVLNVTSSGVVYLRLSFNVIFWIYVAYSYFLALLGEIVCLLAALSSAQLYRQQALLLLFSGIIPIIVSTFDFTYIIFPAWNLTPLSFLFTGGIMLLGIFKFRLLEVAPVPYQAIIQKMLDGVFVIGATHQILDINPAGSAMLGVRPDQFIGQPFQALLPYLPGVSLHHFRETDVQLISEVTSDSPRAYDLRITRLPHFSRQCYGWLVVVRDITEQRALERQLHALAYYDPLTGLPNRVLLHDRIEQALRHDRRAQLQSGVIFLDLDRFKWINDTYGHSMGDEILRQAGQRIKALLRESDTVARFGGDEFVLVLPSLRERDALEQMANRVLAAFATPFVIEEHTFQLAPSLGIARSPMDGDDLGILMRNADIAMYQAKDAGGAQYIFYSDMPQPVA